MRKLDAAPVRRAAARALGMRGPYGLDKSLLNDLVKARFGGYVVFVLEPHLMVAVPIYAVRELVRNSRLRDAYVWVDSKGLHLSWNGGNGGLNLKSTISVREFQQAEYVHFKR